MKIAAEAFRVIQHEMAQMVWNEQFWLSNGPTVQEPTYVLHLTPGDPSDRM